MDYNEEMDSNAMLESVNETNNDTTPQEGTVTSQPEVKPQMFKYEAAGKTIEEPIDLVLKRASMGYDYAQRMEQLKKQSAEFETIKQQNAELSKWQEYDKFARENPKWAEHVKSMWDSRQTMSDPNSDPNDPIVNKLSAFEQMLNSKLTEFGSKFQTYDQWINSQKSQQEDQVFSKEIESVRGAYKDIDFSATNEEGKSLEIQVLEHMRDNHIPSFRAGFRDFYHDKLVEKERLKAKESVANGVQRNQKQGIVSQRPAANVSTTTNYSKMSYEDLANLAKSELGS